MQYGNSGITSDKGIMSKLGRKEIQIDKGKLEIAMMYGATCADCAGMFFCSDDTIVRFIKKEYGMNFAEFSDKRQSEIRLKLRQKQIQVALNGNVTMLIFLGKNLLGQSDKQDITQTSNVVELKYNLKESPSELRKRLKESLESSQDSSEN